MFQGTIYRIMIGAPSDIQKEVEIAKDVIIKWSCMNAEARHIVLLPLFWQDNSYPGYGAHPQKILDHQLVDKSDLLVCFFGAKLGTPTDTAESGSLEEIEEHIKVNKPVMLFFKRKVDLGSSNLSQIEKLTAFRERISGKAMWCEYEDENVFEKVFSEKLTLFLNERWNEVASRTESQNEERRPSFNGEELSLFSRWANNPLGQQYIYMSYIGRSQIHLGPGVGVVLVTERDKAEWEDYLMRLVDCGYIRLFEYDKYGHARYRITKKGYDYADTLPRYDDKGQLIQ